MLPTWDILDTPHVWPVQLVAMSGGMNPGGHVDTGSHARYTAHFACEQTTQLSADCVSHELVAVHDGVHMFSNQCNESPCSRQQICTYLDVLFDMW